MWKKPIVSVTYENERISIKNSLPYLKCVLRLSCVVHGPIYGRFMDCAMKPVPITPIKWPEVGSETTQERRNTELKQG